jgi:hypothetical protein
MPGLFTSGTTAEANGEVNWKMVGVTDGDTIKVLHDGKSKKV